MVPRNFPLKNGSSQVQNLALSVLCIPTSLDAGSGWTIMFHVCQVTLSSQNVAFGIRTCDRAWLYRSESISLSLSLAHYPSHALSLSLLIAGARIGVLGISGSIYPRFRREISHGSRHGPPSADPRPKGLALRQPSKTKSTIFVFSFLGKIDSKQSESDCFLQRI